MSYGFMCTGSGGQTIIDADNPVLHVVTGGNFAVGNVGPNGGFAYITYPKVVGSVLPPQVFVLPDGPAQYKNFVHVGQPRNWTGCYFNVYYDQIVMTGYSSTGKYVACAMSPPASVGTYGMQILNADGSVVFDSGYKIMNFISGTQSWPLVGSVDLGLIYNAWLYALPWTNIPNRYFMISSFADISPTSFDVSIGFNNFQRDRIAVIAIATKTSAPSINKALIVGSPGL